MIKRQERPKALSSRLLVAVDPPSSGSGRGARSLLPVSMHGGGATAVAGVDLGALEFLGTLLWHFCHTGLGTHFWVRDEKYGAK